MHGCTRISSYGNDYLTTGYYGLWKTVHIHGVEGYSMLAIVVVHVELSFLPMIGWGISTPWLGVQAAQNLLKSPRMFFLPVKW